MGHQIRIAGSDVQFACAPGQTILDAALGAGIEMPYSCRKGVCGNCAGTVTRGEVAGPPPNDATPPGQQLFCQCTPCSDLEIVPEAWQRIDPTARKTFTAKVFRNTLVAPDVSLLQLRLPAGKRARFKAGQYLQVQLPDGTRRSYSMANPPHESDTLQLHVRHVPGGRFSQQVVLLQPGDTLDVELPYGTFELREASAAPMLCVVGGTGFAPVKSLLDDLARRRIDREVTLVWGGRDAGGLYLLPAVERWRKVLPRFRFLPALEDAAAAQSLQGFHGRVDEAVRRECPPLAGHEVYCCGSPAMVAAVKKACVNDKGLDPHHFFSDVFVDGPATP
ncbi:MULTISPECIES: FAD-binding oxidoreductase [Ramlibacter]|uniref:2Fe-2S iron-sulfur cluster binding domain-containing protein n=1 Tax=Ramlibacter pinisoli TaxID=2682844 RepID=A0A6N8IY00_9BURK|nr:MULTISPECIES: FAD-binding oxidoreductase [Ramlibacter]MBA2961956.1 2Fe-2S iron-sulfur cluster binding domain-containing protein [Ramlibacter sp. CGMCC 1.13660]MVQ31899.1 2Fe-2S iron-sulfur cluster binding domain-containing protein [Ramlibacter pinisoli]